MEEKVCYVCGSKRYLTFYKKVTLKTKGYDIPVKDGFVCKLCKYRIR